MERRNYYSDSRVRESMRDRAWIIRGQTLFPCEELVDPDPSCYDEEAIALEKSYPVTISFMVCETCHGHGSTVNPSIDAGSLSEEDFRDDPDFREDYYGGAYDIPCPECRGKRVVPDEMAAIKSLPPEVAKRLVEYQEEIDYNLEERLSELRWGC